MEELFKNSLMGQLQEIGLNMDVDKEANPLAIHIDELDIEHSPFANLDKKQAQNPIKQENESKKVVKKRLNDYDFNILQDSAFVDIEDSELSKEEKIEKIEKLIQETDKKLFLIEGRNSKLRDKLLADKASLQAVLDKLKPDKKNSLIKQNFQKNINTAAFAKIKQAKILIPVKDGFGSFVSKYFPKLYKGILMKKALNKLNALSKTASELMAKKIPYGESDQRYDALIEYLSSANTIHAKLIKKI